MKDWPLMPKYKRGLISSTASWKCCSFSWSPTWHLTSPLSAFVHDRSGAAWSKDSDLDVLVASLAILSGNQTWHWRSSVQDWQHCLVIWPIYPDVFFAQSLVFMAEKATVFVASSSFLLAHPPRHPPHLRGRARPLHVVNPRKKTRQAAATALGKWPWCRVSPPLAEKVLICRWDGGPNMV